MQIYLVWKKQPAHMLVKRGDKSAWLVAIFSPLPTTLCVIGVSVLLYRLGKQKQDGRKDAADTVSAVSSAHEVPMEPLEPPPPTYVKGARRGPKQRARDTPDDPHGGRSQSLHRGSLDSHVGVPPLKSQIARVGSTSIGARATPGHSKIPIELSTPTSAKVARSSGRTTLHQLGSSNHLETSELTDVGLADPAGSVQPAIEPQEIEQPLSPSTLVDAASLLPTSDGVDHGYEGIEYTGQHLWIKRLQFE